VLYSYVFYLIGKRDFAVEAYRLRNVIARWFFMVSLTSRYSGAFESRMEQDLAFLRTAKTPNDFAAVLEHLIADAFTEDYWNTNLPNELATSSSRSPSLFAYYAALNLLQARVLFSKMRVSDLLDPAMKAKKAATERHHLFPKTYLSTLNITEVSDTNQIANFALVEWNDNIAIGDTAPSQYYPEYAKRFSPSELSQMHYWHALPENWQQMSYNEFLEARRRKIAQVIRDGYNTLADSTS